MNKIIKAFTVAMLIFMFPLVVNAESELYTASVSGVVTLKIMPDEQSREIVSIPACSKVELLKKNNTWGLVIFENKCGWINLSFTAKNYTDAANSTGNDVVENAKVYSEDGSVNLYNVPSDNELLGSEVKYTVPNDTILNVTRKTDSGWALVSMDGKFAWVESKYTQKYESTAEEEVNNFGIYYVYVMSEEGKGLELRETKEDGEVLAVIPDCIKLTVREKDGDYGYVSFDGHNGWINLKYTTNSMSNAQAGAGIVVNREMSVDAQDGSVDVMSLPTENIELGNTVLGSIKNGTAVFVQRQTQSGWSYVNNAGVKGWLKPGTLSEAKIKHVDKIKTVNPYEVFAIAKKGSGQSLFSEVDGKKVCTVPPGMKMKIVAENGDYGYAVCDYASGWINLSEAAPSYGAVINGIEKKNIEIHTLANQAEVKKIPISSAIYAEDTIAVIEKGDEVVIYAKVKTGSEKWGLVKTDGKWGWINLSQTTKTALPIWIVIIILSVALALILAVISLTLIIRRRRK